MNHTILMLERDDDDRYITQAVFDEYQFNVRVEFVSTSVELKNYLKSCSTKNSPLPSLILLDYHAHPSNAVEILKDLKEDVTYRSIPVVVLSGTVSPDIVKACYANGANSFIQKPSSEVENRISIFIKYWFETVQLAS